MLFMGEGISKNLYWSNGGTTLNKLHSLFMSCKDLRHCYSKNVLWLPMLKHFQRLWTLKMTKHSNGECFSWMKGSNSTNGTTLGNLNSLFIGRHIGGITFIGILMVIGILGNFVILWIYGYRFKSTNYRTFILFLVSIDITNCIVGMPFLVVYLSHYMSFPSVDFCRIGRFIVTFTTNGSAFILVVIAFDRYRKVCRPMEWQMTKFQAMMCCIFAVSFASIVSIPTVILYGNYTVDNIVYNVSGTRCWTDDYYKDGYYPSMFYIGLSILSFIISLVLLVTYVLILKCLYQHKAAKRLIRTRKTTITLLAVTVAFIFSAVPHYSLVILTRVRKTFHCEINFIEGFVFYTFVFSILINSSINPFIYGCYDEHFGRELKRILKCCCRQRVTLLVVNTRARTFTSSEEISDFRKSVLNEENRLVVRKDVTGLDISNSITWLSLFVRHASCTRVLSKVGVMFIGE